jgi:hypothetical protein
MIDEKDIMQMELQIEDLKEDDLEKPEKTEKRKYNKKSKKIDSEKESTAVIKILNFFSEKLLRNKMSDEDIEFHKETVKQISEQYEISITEYILFVRIIVSVGLLLIHYYISTVLLFRKLEKQEKPKEVKIEKVESKIGEK